MRVSAVVKGSQCAIVVVVSCSAMIIAALAMVMRLWDNRMVHQALETRWFRHQRIAPAHQSTCQWRVYYANKCWSWLMQPSWLALPNSGTTCATARLLPIFLGFPKEHCTCTCDMQQHASGMGSVRGFGHESCQYPWHASCGAWLSPDWARRGCAIDRLLPWPVVHVFLPAIDSECIGRDLFCAFILVCLYMSSVAVELACSLIQSLSARALLSLQIKTCIAPLPRFHTTFTMCLDPQACT